MTTRPLPAIQVEWSVFTMKLHSRQGSGLEHPSMFMTLYLYDVEGASPAYVLKMVMGIDLRLNCPSRGIRTTEQLDAAIIEFLDILDIRKRLGERGSLVRTNACCAQCGGALGRWQCRGCGGRLYNSLSSWNLSRIGVPPKARTWLAAKGYVFTK